MSGTKALYGHPLGASGAIRAVTALALRHRWLPPAVNLEQPDPACPLAPLPRGGLERAVAYALSNFFGFDGTNACLLLAAPEVATGEG